MATIALALPMWIAMVLIGGEWCLMPGAHAAELSHAATGASAMDGTHSADGAHVFHVARATPGERDQPAEQHAGGHQTGNLTDPSPAPGNSSHHGLDSGACGERAMCGVAAAPIVRVQESQVSRPAVRPVIVAVDRPASVTFAPELPPPRA